MIELEEFLGYTWEKSYFEGDFKEFGLYHKYNLFATNINEDCFSPLDADEYTGNVYEKSIYGHSFIGKIDCKEGFIFNKDFSLNVKEILALNLKPKFDKNRETEYVKMSPIEKINLRFETGLLDRLGWK